MAKSQLVERVMATDSFKATWDFFTDFRVQTLANVVQTDHLVARTVFPSVARQGSQRQIRSS